MTQRAPPNSTDPTHPPMTSGARTSPEYWTRGEEPPAGAARSSLTGPHTNPRRATAQAILPAIAVRQQTPGPDRVSASRTIHHSQEASMTAIQAERPTAPAQTDLVKTDDDPFGLDITFIEGTPATETVLMCSTGDTCGSSCPSACTTS